MRSFTLDSTDPPLCRLGAAVPTSSARRLRGSSSVTTKSAWLSTALRSWLFFKVCPSIPYSLASFFFVSQHQLRRIKLFHLQDTRLDIALKVQAVILIHNVSFPGCVFPEDTSPYRGASRMAPTIGGLETRLVATKYREAMDF